MTADMATQRGCVRIDFFAALPHELVLRIILNLELRDLLPCMAVSRAWLDTLTLRLMEPYWRQACEELGLSREMVGKLLTSAHPSARSVLYASLKHRSSICSYAPRCEHLTSSYPYNVHYVCQYKKGCQLVGTVYKDFQPSHILVQRVDEESVATILKLELAYPRITENRIIWAHVHHNRFLLCAAASGIWSVYATDGMQPTHGNSNLLVQWRAEPMYDADIRVACCDECGMVCTAKLVTSHMEESFWELRVIELSKSPTPKTRRLPMPKVTRFRLETNNEEITSRRAPSGKKKISLLSQSTEAGTGAQKRHSSAGFGEHCSSHLLLAQWANEVSGFVFRYKAESVLCLSPTVAKRYTVPCDNYEADVMRHHGLNTEFVLSEDCTLLGFIFQSHLITWEVESANQTSLVRISLDRYNYEEMKLISLGHVYSIVGLEFSCSVIVLGTRSGQPLLKCADFAINHCRMVSPFIVFLSSVEDRWLSNIAHPCGTRILYWNKTNRSIEGIGLGEPPSQCSHMESSQPAITRNRKRWQWWHKE